MGAKGVAEFYQGLDDQIGRREPNGASPIRIASFDFELSLSRLIAHLVRTENKRVALMEL